MRKRLNRRQGINAKKVRGRIRPLTDEERIQGQIARGEVQAGPEGARRIAARHEEQYGSAFRRRRS